MIRGKLIQLTHAESCTFKARNEAGELLAVASYQNHPVCAGPTSYESATFRGEIGYPDGWDARGVLGKIKDAARVGRTSVSLDGAGPSCTSSPITDVAGTEIGMMNSELAFLVDRAKSSHTSSGVSITRNDPAAWTFRDMLFNTYTVGLGKEGIFLCFYVRDMSAPGKEFGPEKMAAQVEVARSVPRFACAEYTFAIAEQRYFDPVMLRLLYHTRNLDEHRGQKFKESKWGFQKYMLKTFEKDLIARYDPEWGR